MPAPRRGADALLQALQQGGCSTIFTLSGNHIMVAFDAALEAGMRLLHVRQEAAAVHMAEAWARLTGQVGVALVTGGQGHTNAASALGNALASETPVLLLSGHAPLGELGLGSFQELRQAQYAAPVCKASWTVQSADSLAADVARAMRIAQSGRPGPVHLSLPTDVLEAMTAAAIPDAASFAAAAMPLPARTAALVAQEIAAAERPLLLAPPALCTTAGRAALARIGLPVLGMESPRGVNDPSLGAFAEVLAEADLVVLLGKALDFTLRFGAAAPAARWIVLDADAALLARAQKQLRERLVLSALADPHSAAAALADGVAARADGWTQSVRQAVAHRPAAWASLPAVPGAIPSARLCAALQPFLEAHPQAVFVSDGGEIGQWAQALLQAPHRLINGPAGAIGPSVPFAIAAKAAMPDSPVLAVLGDGTFGFHMAEFDTAVRYGLNFVAVVGNDSRWNAEHQIQLRQYGAQRVHGCELRPATRYDQVVAALGGHGEYVERLEDLPAAMERAFASALPACVNVAIDGAPAPQVKRGG